MQAITIPLRVSGVGTASRQIALLGRQMAGLQGNVNIGVGGGSLPLNRGGARVPATRQARQPQSIGQQIKNAVMTSRVSMTPGGGIQAMPLVNKLLPILTRLNPVLTTATGALLAMGKAAENAAGRLTEFRASALTTGGTAQQTSTLRALGISPESAREFGRTISSDPVATGYAARAGIYNPGGELFGDTNTATNMLKWAEALRKMSKVEATRAARLTGTEDLLPVRDMSNEVFNKLKRAAELHAKAFPPDSIKAAADFNGQMQRLQLNFERFGQKLTDWTIKPINKVLDALNGLMETDFGKNIGDRMKNGTTGGRGLFDPRIINNPGGTPESEQTRAAKESADRLKEIAGMLRNGGAFGGGERARGAVPGNWRGAMPDYYAQQAAALGAFNL